MRIIPNLPQYGDKGWATIEGQSERVRVTVIGVRAFTFRVVILDEIDSTILELGDMLTLNLNAWRGRQ